MLKYIIATLFRKPEILAKSSKIEKPNIFKDEKGEDMYAVVGPDGKCYGKHADWDEESLVDSDPDDEWNCPFPEYQKGWD